MLSLIHVKILDSRVLLNMFFFKLQDSGWFYSWMNKKTIFQVECCTDVCKHTGMFLLSMTLDALIVYGILVF